MSDFVTLQNQVYLISLKGHTGIVHCPEVVDLNTKSSYMCTACIYYIEGEVEIFEFAGWAFSGNRHGSTSCDARMDSSRG